MNWNDNTILITGGATGIGFALAEILLERGNQVIACGRSLRSLEAARSRLPGLVTCRCDVADASGRRDMIEWLAANYPRLNVLINNAGVQQRYDFAVGRVDAAKVAEEIGVNLLTPILLGSELFPLLLRQPAGAIINVTSSLVACPITATPVYCATKAGLHSFTMSLRHQLAGTTVRVIEMVPPIVDTRLGVMPVISPREIAIEALAGLERGELEVLVGIAREKGEALFPPLKGG